MIYITLFIVKLIDNLIQTAKSIATYKNKKLLSSILVTISQLMFYLIIKQVIADSTFLVIIIISIASGIGNYVAFVISDHLKSDDKWHYYITGKDKKDIIKFCEYLHEHNIKYMASDGYDRHGNKTINVTAFSKTKDESKLIEKYIADSSHKYLKEIMK